MKLYDFSCVKKKEREKINQKKEKKIEKRKIDSKKKEIYIYTYRKKEEKEKKNIYIKELEREREREPSGETRKYTTCSRIIEIQAKLSERALELLALPNDGIPRLLLDIGCGSGLSGETLAENGHHWIGLDISQSMLDVALEREADGDLLLGDMGQGLCVRPGVFDGAISIPAVQWLCNADKACNEPRRRLKAFFDSLYRCLTRGARAVLQLHPENEAQLAMITTSAMRAGFGGGAVVDYPHSTRAKKYFLVLTCGPPSLSTIHPKAKGAEDESCSDEENKTVGISDRRRPRKESRR